ncbi:mitochondrial import receptor subunit TOM40 homolog 1-like [Eurytemora carolleeae]|uniref:mitochondrial import receptor subunit TOM40 homolog 1-like n=1 Tax=Eurytemora carolleeae TaxID=1294199 RepID=UPI000C779E57|nr:mitochondrial import receptor subunit TOM40 homolog 1-like [Eurytemora carolleeae]|eukprot:XP_023338480.1 mitochondrial import receptor subunit TOM40 homolog 1-like [Eurytemora affinis]
MGNKVSAETPVTPAAPAVEVDKNPGSMEDLHKKCKDVFPMAFEGYKFLVNKGLSQHFQVSHTLTLSNTAPSGYRFGATYVGASRVISPQEAYPILLGDIDMAGNLQAHIIDAPTKNIRCKMIAQIQQSKWQGCQLTADYKGADYTANLTLANPDLISGTGVGVLQYLQTVTSNISLGAELVYQSSPQLPGGHIAALSLAGRYSGPDYCLASTLSNSGAIHASFWQKCSEDLQVGTEIEANLKMAETVGSLAYQVEIPRAGLVFRGALDSNWNVKGVLEKKLLPLPLTLSLCGLLNHPKQSFQMGAGLIMG